MVEVAKQQFFQQPTESHTQHCASRNRQSQTIPSTRQGISHVSAQHVKTAVRQIDHTHDAKNQGQTGCQQKQQQTVLNAVEQLDEEVNEIHQTSLQPAPESDRALAATPNTLFSLPSTTRKYMSCTGLCALLMVHLPRGLSMTAPSMAA